MSRGPSVDHWGSWSMHIHTCMEHELLDHQPKAATLRCNSQNEAYFTELRPSNQQSDLSCIDQLKLFLHRLIIILSKQFM